MPVGLQVTDYIENCNTVKAHLGKRVIRKDTGERGTIKRAFYLGDCTRYHIHFDGMPDKVTFSVHQKDLIIMGEVQHNGSNY